MELSYELIMTIYPFVWLTAWLSGWLAAWLLSVCFTGCLSALAYLFGSLIACVSSDRWGYWFDPAELWKRQHCLCPCSDPELNQTVWLMLDLFCHHWCISWELDQLNQEEKIKYLIYRLRTCGCVCGGKYVECRFSGFVQNFIGSCRLPSQCWRGVCAVPQSTWTVVKSRNVGNVQKIICSWTGSYYAAICLSDLQSYQYLGNKGASTTHIQAHISLNF